MLATRLGLGGHVEQSCGQVAGGQCEDWVAEVRATLTRSLDLVTCSVCGREEVDPPPQWSTQTSESELERLCGECTREHIRSIEGRLDPRWWGSEDPFGPAHTQSPTNRNPTHG